MNQQTMNYQKMVAILPPGSSPEFTAGASYMLGCVNTQLTLTNGSTIADQPAVTRRTTRTTATVARSRATSIKEPSANTTSGKVLTAIKNKPGITSAELQIETGLNGQQIGTALGGVSGSLVTKKLVIGDAITGWRLAQTTGATNIQTGQRRRGRRPAQQRPAAQAA